MVILAIAIEYKTSTQSIVGYGQCFTQEDCKVPVKTGYCGINYDCIKGKCYSYDIKCKEICYGSKDEDMDGVVDCKDSDCWSSPYCHCLNADYNVCRAMRCYCPTGSARWVVTENEGRCECR